MATRISMLAAVALALLASSAAAAGLKVSPAGGGAFPARSLVLSAPFLPSSFAPKVHVEENGRPVAGVNASAVTRSDRGNFGVVLAIDTSASMRGRAIVRALAAARALAAQRTGEQQLGVIEFNNAVRVPLPPTTDQRAIDRALAGRVPLGAGTHIYDAVDAGVALLQRAGIAAGSVIVLSDGSDHGSGKTPAEVAAAAQAAHVRIFTVGLRSRSFDPQTLRALAAGGGGDFAEADSSQLPRIFTQLGARLASEYLVHYRSVQARGRRIDVSVRVDGVPGVWHGSYSSPPPLAAVLPRRPAEKSFWTSAAALALVAVGCALLVGLAVAVFLSGRRSGNRVRARVAEFISPATAESAGGDTAAPPRVVGRLERSLERRPWWTTFTEELEIARIERPAIQIVYLTAAGTGLAAFLMGALTQSPIGALLAVAGVPLAVRLAIRQRLSRQRALFADRLPSHLQETAASMRAGNSIVGGLRAVADGAAEPARGEFQRVIADEQLGVPLEEALRVVARRMASDDMEQVALVAALHHRTGGNMAEVFDQVADGLRERAELRRDLEALTAQARISRWIVTALPPALLAIISVLNPSYTRPLFDTNVGRILLVAASGMVVMGSLVIKRLVKVEV